MLSNRFMLFIGIMAFGLNATAQNTFELDQKDPKSVVEAIFYAAKTKDFSILNCLCDPKNENDGDTQRICELGKLSTTTEETPETTALINSFITAFKDGKVTGKTLIENRKKSGTSAEVPFWFNHPTGESRSNEIMTLIQRYGNWYLFNF